MQFEQDRDTFIIYLEKDDCIMESLTKFCKDKNIDNGKISGISQGIDNDGALKLKTSKEIKKIFVGDVILK